MPAGHLSKQALYNNIFLLAAVADLSQARIQYSDEVKLANQGRISYSMAVQRVYVTRAMFASARTSSVVLLAHSDGCFFGDGVAVYKDGLTLRILDLYNAGETELIVDVRALLAEQSSRWPIIIRAMQDLLAGIFTLQVEGFQHGILSLKVYNPESNYYTFMINTRRNVPLESRVRKFHEHLEYRQEMNTDGRYMISANYSRPNGDRRHWPRWAVDCYDLEDIGRVMPELLLRDIISHDIFVDIDFKMYDGWLYILCSQHSPLPNDDGDEKSFYYCYRFPVDDVHPAAPWKIGSGSAWSPHSPLPARLEIVRIKRQRPWISEEDLYEANEPFQRLNLQQDVQTGDFLMVECLQDSQSGEVCPKARYYFQPLIFPNPTGYTVNSPNTRIEDIVHTLNIEDLPRGDPPLECPNYTFDKVGTRSYTPTASAFYDVGIQSSATIGSKKGQRFCLSVGSRGRASPISNDTGLLHSTDESVQELLDHDGEPLVDRGVCQFPSNNCSASLLDLLSPSPSMEGHSGATTHDAPSIVCVTACPYRNKEEEYKLILVNFDPSIRFPGLETMELHPHSDHLSSHSYEEQIARSQLWLSNVSEQYEVAQSLQSRKQKRKKEMAALQKSRKRRILRMIPKKRLHEQEAGSWRKYGAIEVLRLVTLNKMATPLTFCSLGMSTQRRSSHGMTPLRAMLHQNLTHLPGLMEKIMNFRSKQLPLNTIVIVPRMRPFKKSQSAVVQNRGG